MFRLEEFHRLGQALQPPVAVRDQACRVGRVGAAGQGLAGLAGEQGLAAQRGGHHPGGDGLAQAVHLHRLGAQGHMLGRVLAQGDGPHVQAGTGRQRHRQAGQGLVVGQRATQGVGGVVEQQQEAVGLVDLAAAPLPHQVARQAVVRRPQRGRLGVAQPLGDGHAVDQVGEQQGGGFVGDHCGGGRGGAAAVPDGR